MPPGFAGRHFCLQVSEVLKKGAMRTKRLFWINQPLYWKGIAAGSMNGFAYSFYSKVYKRHEHRETGNHAPGILILNGMANHS